jgi:C4-type Zn-finger protein
MRLASRQVPVCHHCGEVVFKTIQCLRCGHIRNDLLSNPGLQKSYNKLINDPKITLFKNK